MVYISTTSEEKDWTEYNLIVPAVSVGNIGQLVADLIISTLSPALVGYFYCDSVLPIVGNDPFTEHTPTTTTLPCRLTTAVEVYECKASRVVIVQQRASCIKGRSREFVNELATWIKTCGFRQIFLLTSVFAHERRDSQLTETQLRCVLTEEAAKKGVQIPEGQLQLEHRSDDHHLRSEAMRPVVDPFLPGGGIATRFYAKCVEEQLSAVVLLIFCAEGDNVSDALALASSANAWLHLIHTEADQQSPMWKIPPSWKLLFGSQFDRTLFQ